MLINGISWHVLLVLWAVSVLFFFIMNPISSRIYKISGQKILDSRINYSPEEAYGALEDMGDEGRRLYLLLNRIDFIFPLFFYPAMSLTISYLLQKQSIFRAASSLTFIILVPLIGGISDFGENICIRIMIKHFDSRPTRVARIANYLTLTKYSIIGISVLIIVFLFLVGFL